MANFDTYFPTLLRNEGNYCDNSPTDSGGETYQGISRNNNPDWAGWPTVDAAKKKLGLASPVARPSWPALNAELVPNAALSASVRQLYRARYWNPLGLDGVRSQSVAEQMADHGINTGPKQPIRMVQYLLSTIYGHPLAIDGVMGPATLAALNSLTPSLFYNTLVEMRQAYYYYLAGSPLTSTPRMAEWGSFLSGPRPNLQLRPNPRLAIYLPSWLSRTKVPFAA
jgi:lysozyme family protein